MSDFAIPGVNDKYNTQKIIDALMEAKREPLKRMQKEVDLEKQQKGSWQDVTRRLSAVRDAARSLYGFQNPFNDRVAASSDERTLVATATRQAPIETKQILVKKVATADRFLSKSLPRDFVVDPGEYVFRVGDKDVRLSWKGGSVKGFVDALNAKGGDLLSASVVNDTKDTQVLLIESKLTGSKNRLTLSGAAADLGVKAGMLERSRAASRTVTIDETVVKAAPTQPAAGAIVVQNGAVTLNPGTELSIPLRPAAPLNKNMVLELSVKVEKLPEQVLPEQTAPPGPSVPPTGGIDFQGIHVEGDPSRSPLPEWQPPKPPERIDDLRMLFVEGDGKVIPLPPLTDSDDFQKIQVPAGDLASTLQAIDLKNRNTYRRLTVKDISLFDRTQRGDFVPTRALSEAGDAQVTVDGVDVTRPSNTVDDLLPGVTLTLKGPSSSPVTLNVKPDTEGIKKQVMSFVGAYNRTITQIDVLTRKEPQIIDDADYLSDDEKKKAHDDLGLLMGEISLMQVKNSMQNTMMNPYPTSLGRDMRLLAQIGISTDARAPGAQTLDKTRLRGYLEIDDQKLAAAIEQHPEAVKELFGSDTTGSLVVNAGAAYTLDRLLGPYVQTGGIYPQRVNDLDSRIASNSRNIDSYKSKLDDYQAELKRKYGHMQSSLDALQKNSQSMQNFNKQNQ
ncbi:MAG TPA: flagellar filament capping protein FliD [Spirochaetia bacterium]|nr:flagellar filament capping protein FliD [Spirochaetia bacterium]